MDGNVTGDNSLPYTLPSFIEEELSLPPANLTCVLINKLQERCVPVPEVRYTGFQVEAGWVFGYGMDQHACFRNLPYIGVSASHK